MVKLVVRRLLFAFMVLGLVVGGAPQSVLAFDQEETPVVITGEINVYYSDDFDSQRAELFYELEDKKSNQRFKLKIKGKVPEKLRSGAMATVRGKAKKQEIYLALDEQGGGSIEFLAQAAAAEVVGEQKTLVMIAHFLDEQVPCTTASIDNLMFTDPTGNSVNHYYQDTSQGRVKFTGQVVGPFTIGFLSTSSCNIGAWADAVDAAAAAEGVDLSRYARKVYVLPAKNGCGSYAGIGQVGGAVTRSWIFRCNAADTFAHELGHNLGLSHASTPTSEYGDRSDIMGFGGYGLRHLNAPHQEHMGWRPGDGILTVKTDGVYEITAMTTDAKASLAPHMLKIAKPDTGEHYYFSYRVKSGFDVNVPWWHLDRVNVHRYKGNGSQTFYLGALEDNLSFVDEINGLTVTQLSRTAERATVSIRFHNNPTLCTTGMPLVSLSPADQSGAPGAALSYTLNVSNTDSAGCSSSTYTLDRILPNGWAGTLSPANLSLAPGQKGQATLTVTSPASASAATYSITASAAAANEPTRAASAGASLTVVAPCIPAAPLMTITPETQSGEAGTTLAYTLTLSNGDSNRCAASTYVLNSELPGGWAGSFSAGSLTLAPGASASTTLRVTSATSAAPGSQALLVRAGKPSVTGQDVSRTLYYQVQEPMPAVDTHPPTAPTSLSATIQRKQIQLTWNPATDNQGVAKYRVMRDGTLLGETTTTSYADSNVVAGATYNYAVIALDAAGNQSPPSGSVTISFSSSAPSNKPPSKK